MSLDRPGTHAQAVRDLPGAHSLGNHVKNFAFTQGQGIVGFTWATLGTREPVAERPLREGRADVPLAAGRLSDRLDQFSGSRSLCHVGGGPIPQSLDDMQRTSRS